MRYKWQDRQADYQTFNRRNNLTDGELALAWVKVLLTVGAVIVVGWVLLVGAWVVLGN